MSGTRRNYELTERELYVLYIRLYRPRMSLKAIGLELGVSANRVRQLHATGARKLREHLRKEKVPMIRNSPENNTTPL